MRAIARQCAGRGVEVGKRAPDSGIVFQGVEAGIDRDGRALEVVTELHAFVGERWCFAECSGLAEAVHAQTQSAAFAADKPAVREMVARGKTAASATVKARKSTVRVRALVGGRTAAEG